MINQTTLVGRLTKDPELKYSQQGTAICNFTVAVNRGFKSQDGQDADFINCVVFKAGAESLANYQKKGNLVGVVGRIQTRSFDGKDGNRVFMTEVVANNVQFLESKGSNQQQSQPQQPQQNQQNQTFEQAGDEISDDLPF